MNSFDLAVCAALAIAIGFGFRTGLLRSAMTILAYLLAAPIALALMPLIAPQIAGNPNSLLCLTQPIRPEVLKRHDRTPASR